jgi:hypothetical protein
VLAQLRYFPAFLEIVVAFVPVLEVSRWLGKALCNTHLSVLPLLLVLLSSCLEKAMKDAAPWE